MHTPLPAYKIARRMLWYEQYDRSAAFNSRAVLFLLAHMPLALAIQYSTIVATLHALAVLVVGLQFTLRRSSADKLAFVVSYIAGAELLWRLGHAHVFWEYGKYSAAFLMLVYFFSHGLSSRAVRWPLIYFALLIPSCFLSWDRELISSHVSGPFALAVTTAFFAHLRLRFYQLRRLFLAFIAPPVGMLFLATYRTLTAPYSLAFAGPISGRRTSAGIGPNQMSTILGLALFLAFLYLFTQKKNRQMKFVIIALMFWLAAQCAMTYSRGGLWSGLIAMGIAAFYLFRSRHFRIALVTGFVIVAPIVNYLMIPALENLSDGTLVNRFKSFDTTGRDERAWADLEAFLENPILGVGPGQPRPGGFDMTAHTEMTRLPAEHGVFGVIALLMMIMMAFRSLGKRPDLFATAFATSLTAWALLTMMHSAMRLYAPAFAFGLANAILLVRPLMPALRRGVHAFRPVPGPARVAATPRALLRRDQPVSTETSRT